MRSADLQSTAARNINYDRQTSFTCPQIPGRAGSPHAAKSAGSPTRGLARRSGVPRAGILASYPAAKSEDIDAALAYAAEVVRRAPSTCPLNSPRELQGG